MLDEVQARAYAEADFSEPHDRFVTLLQKRLSNLPEAGRALDLGCGPGDISFRFATALPGWSADGIDASPPMLEIARKRARGSPFETRIAFHEGLLPVEKLPRDSYELFFSNSLLHHLPDPAILWSTIDRFADAETRVFVMDLLRPESREDARALVDRYAAAEPEILRTDFYNSLLAAYRLEEIEDQLKIAGLSFFQVERISDRHVIIWK